MNFDVFTLNCWGIPMVSKDRKPRFEAIAEVLALSDYDVVCLQEVWSDSDFNFLRESVIDSLPYSFYFYSGVIGSGVCIFSKHIILDVFFHQWAVNGYIHKIQHGDWFGGKGIGLCRLKVRGFNINVYSAHLHAEYNRISDEYLCHRVQQAYDSAQFIQQTSGTADIVILAGDLNTEPGDLAYRILIHLADLKDAFEEIREEYRDIHRSNTNESFYNSYATKQAIKSGEASIRIDYILYHAKPDVKVNITGYSHPLPTRVPNKRFSYSDHEGIASTLRLERIEPVAEEQEGSDMLLSKIAILDEGIAISESALHILKRRRCCYLTFTALLFLLLICTCPFDAPRFNFFVHLGRLLITVLMCYTFIMGTLWNNIEAHGILAGKLAMEVSFNKNAMTKLKL